MIVVAAVLLGSAGCGSEASNTSPLTCPAPTSYESKSRRATSIVATRQLQDEVLVGDTATMQIEPGAGLGGNVIVCGQSVRLILRDAVYSRVLVSGSDTAEVILQDDTPEPNDLELVGAVTRTVRCNQDKFVSDRPPCKEYFIEY